METAYLFIGITAGLIIGYFFGYRMGTQYGEAKEFMRSINEDSQDFEIDYDKFALLIKEELDKGDSKLKSYQKN